MVLSPHALEDFAHDLIRERHRQADLAALRAAARPDTARGSAGRRSTLRRALAALRDRARR